VEATVAVILRGEEEKEDNLPATDNFGNSKDEFLVPLDKKFVLKRKVQTKEGKTKARNGNAATTLSRNHFIWMFWGDF